MSVRTTSPLAHRCAYCGAIAGAPCMTKAGKVARSTHKIRRERPVVLDTRDVSTFTPIGNSSETLAESAQACADEWNAREDHERWIVTTADADFPKVAHAHRQAIYKTVRQQRQEPAPSQDAPTAVDPVTPTDSSDADSDQAAQEAVSQPIASDTPTDTPQDAATLLTPFTALSRGEKIRAQKRERTKRRRDERRKVADRIRSLWTHGKYIRAGVTACASFVLALVV